VDKDKQPYILFSKFLSNYVGVGVGVDVGLGEGLGVAVGVGLGLGEGVGLGLLDGIGGIVGKAVVNVNPA
jgi:hypothetical protein